MAKDTKINSMEALRDHAILTIEKLSRGEIDTSEAGVTGKLCESVISTVKAQIAYSSLIGEEPNIPFMNECRNGKTLEGTPQRSSLPAPKSHK